MSEHKSSSALSLLVVSSGVTAEGEGYPIGSETLLIGRDPGCTITLAEKSVSRRHASVARVAEGIKLTDLNSGNGTWVDEKSVPEAVLTEGQRFRIGSTVFECAGTAQPAEHSETAQQTQLLTVPVSPEIAQGLAQAPKVPPPASYRVRILSARGIPIETNEIEVPGGPATIGRGDQCAVVIPSKGVSRQHAEIRPVDEGFRIVDLDSMNGVWVNDRRVEDVVVRPGEVFRVGREVTLVCELDGPPPEPKPTPAPADVSEAGATRAVPSVSVPGDSLPGVQGARETPSMELEGHATRQLDARLARQLRAQGEQQAKADAQETPETRVVETIERDKSPAPESTPAANETRVLGPSTPTPPPPTPTPTPAPATNETRVLETPKPAPPPAPNETRVLDTSQPASQPAANETRVLQTSTATSPPAANETRVLETPVAKPKAPKPPAPKKREIPEGTVNITRMVSAEEAELVREQKEAAQAVAEEALKNYDASESIVIPRSAITGTEPTSLHQIGTQMEVGAHEPFLIDDMESLWYVEEGQVDIFTVALENQKPSGTRSHFLGILPEQCFFGFDLVGTASGFLAVGKNGTKLRKIRIDRLSELSKRSNARRQVATMIDVWITGLMRAMARGLQHDRTNDVVLRAREKVNLESGMTATGEAGVLWIPTASGELLFNDMGEPSFAERQALFPITPDSWIQARATEFGPLSVTPLPTDAVLARDVFWRSLEVFHETVREFEFVTKRFLLADEWVRLRDKERHIERAREEAEANIAGVLEQGGRPKEFLATGSSEPVLRACKLVGENLGMTMKRHPAADERMTYEEKIGAIANASGCRTRVVALRDEWWESDHGPMVAQLEKTQEPVALLPTGAHTYEAVDPKTGDRGPVDAEVASALGPFAYTFYRPFPDGELGVMDVVKFGARGLGEDFRLLVAMGITVGLFGTVTPYLTGQIYDAAIPQADRSMLIGFGLALFAAAAGSSIFKFVQGVATVRVQGRMEYKIQAALWDRLLNLPANFFRKYSAGDLSERVNGIDRIQQLVSGAGVSAILGSFSGLFYVFQMFMYNLTLAGLAVFLTLIFVGTTTTANYLQLRHQRVELQFKGRISGLVLNLITGVTKLRISGAENHAFRVWAKAFSDQRKISFKVGTIQNVIQVFNKVFPIISSMAIFLVMIYEQGKAAESGQAGLTTGEFIAFNASYGLFLAAMQALGDASLNMLRVVPIYERLKPIITTSAEIDSSKVFPGKLTGDIKLSHVHFRYSEDGPWIIKDLSLDINAGEMVAFVGGSGCGKSTLMRLMLGFEQPSTGAIYYDGQDLGSLDARMVRQQMGVVLQQSKVMPTEIYRNIIGVSSRSIDEAWEAAEKAGLAEDIRAMPMGMHTYVSEGGGTFSGGQRQRLMIARAVVNKPKVIFLDEATSALDNKAQAIVTESMDKLDATRIVIAHRLTTVMNADKICYLESGKIAEMGTYQELMDKNGLFAELARRQMA